LGSIVRFPSDLVTEHDRRRLTAAAEGSVFEIEFRKNKQDVIAPYLVRCGHMRPSYRLRKTGDGWEAIELGPERPGIVIAKARRAEDLLIELGQRKPS
jgi:hypothetical protein